MSAHINDIFNSEEFEARLDAALQTIAIDVGTEIQEGFHTAIANFYADYSPNSYDRTLSMYKFSSGYRNHKKLWRRNGNCNYNAGIYVDPSFVGGSPYAKNPPHGLDVDADFVYEVSYMKGIHGFNRADTLVQRYKEDVRDKKGRIIHKKGQIIKTINEHTGRTEFLLRDDGWKPGYDIRQFDWIRTFDKALYARVFMEYNRNYQRKNYTPPTSSPPDANVRRQYKQICKSIGRRLDVAMANLF